MTQPIRLTALVAASPDTVWACWTGPDHICKWNAASDDWHTTTAASDLRPGGHFSSRMEAKDGSFGFDFGGVFDVVEAPTRLEYTLGDGRKVALRFDAEGQGTRVTQDFDPESENPAELQRAGWQAILDNFKAYTEGR